MANKDYNVYADILDNYKLKSTYDEAKKRGDTAAMEQAAKSANAVRERMTDNGHGDVANRLKGYNTAQTKQFLDYYPTQGKSELRPYLYNSKLSTQYGLTPEQIDGLISFNDVTKEVSFGGKNYGKADALAGGASYWEPVRIDSMVDDYINTSGIQPKMTSTQLMDRSNYDATMNAQKLADSQFKTKDDINSMFKELYGYSMDTNPFETEVGKSIMQKYDLAALQGRDNEVASGAGSNSGNIDSFSAANALRQQTAITAQGQQMVIADQAQRVNNVLATLSGMTDNNVKLDTSMQNTIALQQNQAGRLFGEGQESKMNDHAINADYATIMGYEPKAWQVENNVYFGEDGMLLNPETDFGTIIKNAEEKLKTTTDPEEKRRLQSTIDQATYARQFKVNNYPEYAKYASDVLGTYKTPTLEGRNSDVNKYATEGELDIMDRETVTKEKDAALKRVLTYIEAGIKPSQEDLDILGVTMETITNESWQTSPYDSLYHKYVESIPVATKSGTTLNGTTAGSDSRGTTTDNATNNVPKTQTTEETTNNLYGYDVNGDAVVVVEGNYINKATFEQMLADGEIVYDSANKVYKFA